MNAMQKWGGLRGWEMSNILQTSYMDGPLNYCAVEGRELVIVPRRSVGRKLHFVLTIRIECGLEREKEATLKPVDRGWNSTPPLVPQASKRASEEGRTRPCSFPSYVLRNLDPAAPSGPCLNDVFIILCNFFDPLSFFILAWSTL